MSDIPKDALEAIDWLLSPIATDRRAIWWQSVMVKAQIELERLRSVADAEMKLREGNFAEIERLRADLDEQCRLLGAGGSRELRLMAERDLASTRIASLHASLEAVQAERDALRELMNVYNLGGWTDAVAPMQRALAAEARVRELEAALGRGSIERCVQCAGHGYLLSPRRGRFECENCDEKGFVLMRDGRIVTLSARTALDDLHQMDHKDSICKISGKSRLMGCGAMPCVCIAKEPQP